MSHRSEQSTSRPAASTPRRVYMLLSGPLTHGAAGLANSVVARASALARAGRNVTILVDVWQPDLEFHVEGLRESGRLCSTVDVRNMYSDLAETEDLPENFDSSDLGRPSLSDYTAEMTSKIDDNDDRIIRFYNNGQYTYFGFKSDRSVIIFLDELVGGVRARRLYFDASAKLIRATVFNKEEAVVDEFYSSNGIVYSKIEYNNARDEGAISVRSNNLTYRKLISGATLLTHWLVECFDLGPDDFLISEYAFKFDALVEVTRKMQVPVVYTLHNSHLGPPYDAGAPLKPEFEVTFQNASDMDALVVLTPQQKFDIVKRYPELKNVYSIPHATPQPLEAVKPRSVEREAGLVVLVGRLTEIKGQRRAVETFSSVLDKHPDSKLELWGRGEDEAAISRLISDLGLRDRVFLKGFTKDTSEVYERAEIALFPSYYEGQSLSLLEAMRAGCVPVSYDFKYGARMIIDDHCSGVLVDRGDDKDLMDSVTALLSDRKLLRSMSDCARDKSSKFSAERLVREWDTLFSRVVANRVSGGSK